MRWWQPSVSIPHALASRLAVAGRVMLERSGPAIAVPVMAGSPACPFAGGGRSVFADVGIGSLELAELIMTRSLREVCRP